MTMMKPLQGSTQPWGTRKPHTDGHQAPCRDATQCVLGRFGLWSLPHAHQFAAHDGRRHS